MSERHQEKSLIATWADAQQKVLEGWVDLVQKMESPSRAATWNATMQAWQMAVQETLDAQAHWLSDWAGRVQVTSGSPTELRKNVQQAQVLLLHWTAVQQQLWQGWFYLAQQFGPTPEADPQADDLPMRTLRESGQSIINAQVEWAQQMHTWMANLPGG